MLEDGIKKATEDKEVRAKIEGMYHEVEYLNAQEYARFLKTDYDQARAIFMELGLARKDL